MNTRGTLALVMAATMVFQVAVAEELPSEVTKRPSLQVYATEFAAGMGGLVSVTVYGLAAAYVALITVGLGRLVLEHSGSFVAGWMLLGPGYAGVIGGAATVAAAPAVSGYVAFRVGEAVHEGGAQTAAVVGSYVGAMPAAGLAYAGYRLADSRQDGWLGVPFYIIGAAFVPLGATIGYNLSIPKSSVAGRLGESLQPPNVTFTNKELPDHSIEYGVKIQLVSIRF